ncbi:hypothetical protein Lser_V15G35409 [Lactuca serriola]
MKVLKYFVVIFFWLLICTFDIVCGKKLDGENTSLRYGHGISKGSCSTTRVGCGFADVAIHGGGHVGGHLVVARLRGNLGGIRGGIEKSHVRDTKERPNGSNKNVRGECLKDDGSCSDLSDEKTHRNRKRNNNMSCTTGVCNIFNSSGNNDSDNGTGNIIGKDSGITNTRINGNNSGNTINVGNSNNVAGSTSNNTAGSK